jgi:hypothetical protein
LLVDIDTTILHLEGKKCDAAEKHTVNIGGKLPKRIKEMWPSQEEMRLVKSEQILSKDGTIKRYNVYTARKKVYFEE